MFFFILQYKTLISNSLFPQKDNSNLFPQIYLFLFNFPASLLSFILPLQTPLSSHSPPIILSKPPSETSIFRSPTHKTLKNTNLSKQIFPQQAIHQTDKHKIRTLTHASSGRRKTRIFTFLAFKSRHPDDSCTSSRAIQKTTVVISGNHCAASGEGPR